MTSLTLHDIPNEVEVALRLRAAQHGHSVEAEAQAILVSAVRTEGRLRLGSVLSAIGRGMALNEQELRILEEVRNKAPAGSAFLE